MNLFKKVVLLLVLCCSTEAIKAQQDPHFTQYMYNTMSVNPAYAGSQGHLVATFLGRTQWVGLDGAPDTQTLSFDTPLKWKGVGLGINAINDQVGPASEIYIDANPSYTISTGEDGKLAFGLKFGARLLSVDVNKLTPQQVADSNLQSTNKAFTTLGAGIYYYTNKFYAGLSVPNFLPTDNYDDINNIVVAERFHFFAIAGYVFDLDENVKFKPATLMKLVSGAPLSVDVSANFLFNEKFNAGVSWRLSDSLSAMLGFNISDRFHIGYAYDLVTTDLRVTNSGSHEILLRYNFFNSSSNPKSPRFF